jgi:hypothetical protein
VAITTTAEPEHVTGVLLTVVFAAWPGRLSGSAAKTAAQGATVRNFARRSCLGSGGNLKAA